MGKKTKKIVIIVAVVVLVVAAAIGIGMLVSSKGNTSGDLSDLDLGNTYLDELQYDQALAFFEGIIEIEPKNVEAYLGVVEVYIRTGEFEKALEYAKKGYKATGDARLQEKIDMLEKGNITASNGWVMRRTQYDANGVKVWWHDMVYGDKGRVSKITAYDGAGTKTGEVECAYNEDGKQLLGYGYVNNTGRLMKIENVYEGDLKVKTIDYQDADGMTINSTRTYQYDEAGRMIREDADYAYAGAMDTYTLYERDAQGKEVKRESYNVDGTLQSRWLTTYDENGRRIATENYNGEGVLDKKTVYEYDSEGKVVNTKEYDGNGNLKSETKVSK